jgi:hypothetical protein
VPVQQSHGHAGKALAVAAVGVIIAVGLAFAVSVLASRGKVDVRLGDEEFSAGQTKSIAEDIAERGPVCYGDLIGGDRPICIHHDGDDPERGWVAFIAVVPGSDCLVQWDRERELFVDECDGSNTYPPGGDGLEEYPTTVEDGRLYVDLNPDDG